MDLSFKSACLGEGWGWPSAVQCVFVCVCGQSCPVCAVPVCLGACSRQPLMNTEALSGGHKSQGQLLLP